MCNMHKQKRFAMCKVYKSDVDSSWRDSYNVLARSGMTLERKEGNNSFT